MSGGRRCWTRRSCRRCTAGARRSRRRGRPKSDRWGGASACCWPSATTARAGTRSARSTATSCSTRPGWWPRRNATAAPLFDRAVTRVTGASMRFDHRRILATAISRLRAKLKYRPVVFELMADEFTLTELQRTVEAISGRHLHKQNFRRLVEGAALVEPTGHTAPQKRGTAGGPVPLPARNPQGAPGAGLPLRRPGVSASTGRAISPAPASR